MEKPYTIGSSLVFIGCIFLMLFFIESLPPTIRTILFGLSITLNLIGATILLKAIANLPK